SEVRHYRSSDLQALAARSDVIVVYRVPATTQLLELLGSATVPVLFDVDDLIVDPSVQDEIPALRMLPPDEAELWMQGVHRYRTTLEACDGYVGSTQLLVDHIGALTGLPTYRFSNGVGLVTARRSDTALRRVRRPGPLRIGYFSGTKTHDADWQAVEPAVLEVLTRHPDVELWLVGHLKPTQAVEVLGSRLHQLPLQDWRALPDLLRDLDVNLAPLELDLGKGGRFNEAKSAIKQLEAALVETPTVATPTQPFREAISDGVNGMLATTHEEWVQAVDLLLRDPAARHRMGARARRDALLQLSPHLQGQRYLAILEAAVARGPLHRVSTWEPVALDGPPARVRLEPYTAEPVPGLTRTQVLRERALVARDRVTAVLAKEGVSGVARAALRVTSRRLHR
ncbi:MAG: glycosyl transferase group 1, partial [Frankiales bacterium]|nr:glycosyl transferase group 1 [Frankiales bacterium]